MEKKNDHKPKADKRDDDGPPGTKEQREAVEQQPQSPGEPAGGE